VLAPGSGDLSGGVSGRSGSGSSESDSDAPEPGASLLEPGDAIETDAERAGGKPAVVVDLETTLSSVEDGAIAMLEHYRESGPARPADAHAAATGEDTRVPAYTLNRQLRRAGRVEHVGRGRYDYSLRKRIEAGLPPDRDDEMAAIYARDLEAEVLD
jgi:hypothetical protein